LGEGEGSPKATQLEEESHVLAVLKPRPHPKLKPLKHCVFAVHKSQLHNPSSLTAKEPIIGKFG